MDTVIHYIIGTRTPLADLLAGRTSRMKVLPPDLIEFDQHENCNQGYCDDALSEYISKIMNGYLGFAELLPTGVRMEVLGYCYYLLLAMKDEMVANHKPINELDGWKSSFERLNLLLNQKFQNKPQSHV